MGVDSQRKNIDPFLTSLAKPFKNVNPDILTWLALLMSFLAGAFFYFATPENEPTHYYLIIAVLFVFLNGLFDALDGKVAKLTGKASKRGDFLDHAIDRYADVLIVGGLALSSFTDLRLGLVAMSAMLLTSYMGTQAQAVGAARNYGGLLGRADRIVLLSIFPILQHLSLIYYPTLHLPYGLSVLDFLLIIFSILGIITTIQRFLQTLRWFKEHDSDN